MDAQLSRLAAVAFQSPLWKHLQESHENLSQETIAELVAAKTFANANPDTINRLQNAVSSLAWAERNRIWDWHRDARLKEVMNGWLRNPIKCIDLPISNRDRYPDVEWRNRLHIGTIEGFRLIALGRERGTNALVVSRDDGVQSDYFAVYLYEMMAHTQGKIELIKDFEKMVDVMDKLDETQLT